MEKPVPGNYLEQIIKLNDEGLIPKGKVTFVNILHDDDCGIFAGRACSCVPDMEFVVDENES